MGANKLLLNIEGEALVRRSARCLVAARPVEVIAVVGYDSEAVLEALSGLPLLPIVNPQFEAGIGASIAAGVQAAAATSEGFLIALADMPHVAPELLRRLFEEFDGDPYTIVAPEFQGRRGHPVLFGAAHRLLLTRLQGDRGARDIIERHRDHLRLVVCESESVLQDWDYPADLPDGIEVR